MALSYVQPTNTFKDWRLVTNDLIDFVSNGIQSVENEPPSANEDERFLVSENPVSGTAFEGHANDIAIRRRDAVTNNLFWRFVNPEPGFLIRNLSNNTFYIWDNVYSSPPAWTMLQFDEIDELETFMYSYVEDRINEKSLNESNNLSDLNDNATARNNLDVYSTTETHNNFLDESSNLSDLNDNATARNNLDVYSITEIHDNFLDESSNLSDLENNETARNNLDVYSTTETNDLDDETELSLYAYVNSNCIGLEQSWQDVSSNRSTGTVYKNNSDKPIQISISLTSTQDSPTEIFQLKVDDIPVSSVEITSSGIEYSLGSIIVPKNSSYEVTSTGNESVSLWAELR